MPAQLPLLDAALQEAGEVEVDAGLFARPWNSALAHRITVAHAANGRVGSSKQKTRGEVKHTTKRLYRQKGTGRARAGMSSSPVRRGGGRAFPSTPQVNNRRELNRKEFRAGMATVLSQLSRERRLFVTDELKRSEAKTKAGAALLTGFADGGKVLLVDTEIDANMALSVRNLHWVGMTRASGLLATELMRHRRTVLTKSALAHITAKWGGA